MDVVLKALLGIFHESVLVLYESAPWMLLGLFVAALIKGFIPDSQVVKHLGKPGAAGVIKAALFGIPIPLCSCGVIPAALGLRKQGASRGATVSFLVSTPETGVDSIAVTWALLDPVMTIFRPVAAFITAMIAGFFENVIGHKDDKIQDQAINGVNGECESGCCSSDGCENPHNPETPVQKIKQGFHEVFGELLSDIGIWFVVGVLLAGIVSYLVPENAIGNYMGKGIAPMLVMLVVGIPLYICATSSTPLAAALIMKGLSPGAALVFLIAGPATNAATMTLVGKFLGKRSLAIYIFSIASAALGMGFLLDYIYNRLGIHIQPALAIASEKCESIFCLTHPVGWASSVVLIGLLITNLIMRGKRA